MIDTNLEPSVIWAPCERYGRPLFGDHTANKEPK